MKKIIQKLASKYKKKKELKSKDDENFARLIKQEGQARHGYNRAIGQARTALYPERERKHRNETWVKPRMKKAKELGTESSKKYYKSLKSSKKATPQADIRDIVKSVKRGKKEDALEAKLNEYRERRGEKKKKTTGWKK